MGYFFYINNIASELILGLGALILLVLGTMINTTSAYRVHKNISIFISILLTIALFFSILTLTTLGFESYTSFLCGGALRVSDNTLIVKTIILFLSLMISLLTPKYLSFIKLGFEYHVLILLNILGCLLIIIANDFLIFYISLEMQALAFYILAALRKTANSVESGLKYFIIGSFSSAILLFGMSLIILTTGSFNFDDIEHFVLYYPLYDDVQFGLEFINIILILGFSLIILSLLIKIGMVPFHYWVADVYEGMPLPVAMFFSTIPKLTLFFILTNFLLYTFNPLFYYIQPILLAVGILSLLVGSLSTLAQLNIRRFLAFSSITHFGFILIGFSLGTNGGVVSAYVYLLAYLFLTLGLWSILLVCNYVKDNTFYQITKIGELGGLYKNNPGLSFFFVLLLLSMAGLPPLIGFYVKTGVFYSLFNLISLTDSFSFYFFYFYFILLIMVFASIISIFYYIRLIKIIFKNNSNILPKIVGEPTLFIILALICSFIIYFFLFYIY